MSSRQTPSNTRPATSKALKGLPARRRRPGGLVSEVVDGIAGRIRQGRIRPGDKLPTEAEIMATFDVSRTVVREAISRLQASKLVETRHGIGTFAIAPAAQGNFSINEEELSTLSDVIAVLELRISLETEAAGLAALRHTPLQLKAMSAALRAFQDSIELDSDAVPSDFQFHMEVARATGNRHFAELMTYLGTMIIPRTRVNTPNTAPEGRLNYLRKVHKEHINIFNAISDKDFDSARAAMRTHLSNSRDRLKKAQTKPATPRRVKPAT